MKHCYALIVGIDNYKDASHFMPLPFAQADARSLYELLVDPERGGWLPNQVVYLDSEMATRDELESQLRDVLLVRSQPGDLVLCYFAGRIFIDPATYDGYLALEATRAERPAMGLHLPTFVDHYLYDSRADHILAIFDCAHSGPGWREHDLEQPFGQALLDLPRNKGRVILTSQRSDQISQQQMEHGHGVFMAHMLDALEGAAANPRTGRITLGTLYDYLDDHITRDNLSYPVKLGREYGSMVLMEWAEWKTAATPALIGKGRGVAGVKVTPLHILVGHHGHSDDVVFSPDGALLASCGEDMTVRLWDTAGGTLVHTFAEHNGAVMGVDISPDGQLLASCSEDKTIRLWDITSRKPLRTLEGHQSAVWAVAFSLDNQWLASCSNDETVRLWRPADGRVQHILRGHNNVVVGVDFSYENTLLASCSFDRTICLWDVASASLQKRLRYSDIIYGVAWSPRGNLLASCSSDGIICIWDVATGQVLQTLSGHEGAVWTVDFSADGRLLVSGSEDGSMKLWDVYQGNEVQSINHRIEIYGVVFGANGLLANSAEDGAVRIWRAEVVDS